MLWKEARAASDDDDGADDEGSGRRRMFARAFSVFNERQVDGYEPIATDVPLLPDSERVPHAEAFLANLGVTTIFGGCEAYYSPSTDTVHLPPFERFATPRRISASSPTNSATPWAPSTASIAISAAASDRPLRGRGMRRGNPQRADPRRPGIAHHPRSDPTPPTSLPGCRCSRTTHARYSPRRARPSRPPIGCGRSSLRPRSWRHNQHLLPRRNSSK